jgi:hypothetical protein
MDDEALARDRLQHDEVVEVPMHDRWQAQLREVVELEAVRRGTRGAVAPLPG